MDKAAFDVWLLGSSILSLKLISKMICNPERSLAHIMRQTQSKDLRFGLAVCNEHQTQDTRPRAGSRGGILLPQNAYAPTHM